SAAVTLAPHWFGNVGFYAVALDARLLWLQRNQLTERARGLALGSRLQSFPPDDERKNQHGSFVVHLGMNTPNLEPVRREGDCRGPHKRRARAQSDQCVHIARPVPRGGPRPSE